MVSIQDDLLFPVFVFSLSIFRHFWLPFWSVWVLYRRRLFSQWLQLVPYTFPDFSGFIQDLNNIARLKSPHCTQLIVLIRSAFCRCFLAVSCDLMSVVLRLCVFSPTFRGSNVSLDSSTNNSVGILFSLLNITTFGVIPVLSWTLAL